MGLLFFMTLYNLTFVEIASGGSMFMQPDGEYIRFWSKPIDTNKCIQGFNYDVEFSISYKYGANICELIFIQQSKDQV